MIGVIDSSLRELTLQSGDLVGRIDHAATHLSCRFPREVERQALTNGDVSNLVRDFLRVFHHRREPQQVSAGSHQGKIDNCQNRVYPAAAAIRSEENTSELQSLM